MKKELLVLIFGIVAIVGCSSVETKDQITKLKTELEQTKTELNNCSAELAEIKNTAENRFIRAKKLLSEKNLYGAKSEFQGIVDNFKGSNDAKIALKEIAKIDGQIEQKRVDEERKKALGYKILKPNAKVKYGDLSLRFEKIWKGNRWTFDNYGRRYFLRDAERGNSHIMTRVSITSENKNPSLPPILVYQMNNGELVYLGTQRYKFRRWEDYASYLGNYSDYGNDFSHSKTIPFNCGVELSNDDLKSGTIYVVLKKQGCFIRTNVNLGNPEIVYEESTCSPKNILKVEDFDNDYVLIKKL